jgi:hypothetical protein
MRYQESVQTCFFFYFIYNMYILLLSDYFIQVFYVCLVINGA